MTYKKFFNGDKKHFFRNTTTISTKYLMVMTIINCFICINDDENFIPRHQKKVII